jgi:single-strand DNA-binding protein
MSNQIMVVGNLTRDPELRYTPTGAAVAKFGLAVNRFYTNRNGEKVEQTDFFTVNAWRQLAENIAETCKTGTRVIVSGRLQSRTWETEEGAKRTVVEIEADEVGPSLRWATAQVTKASRGGPGEWANDTTAGDTNSEAAPQEVHAAT